MLRKILVVVIALILAVVMVGSAFAEVTGNYSSSDIISQLTPEQRAGYKKVLEENREGILADDRQSGGTTEEPLDHQVVIESLNEYLPPIMLFVRMDDDDDYGRAITVMLYGYEGMEESNISSATGFILPKGASYMLSVGKTLGIYLYSFSNTDAREFRWYGIYKVPSIGTQRLASATRRLDNIKGGAYVYSVSNDELEAEVVTEVLYDEQATNIISEVNQVLLYSLVSDEEREDNPEVWDKVLELGDSAMSYDEAIALLSE